jgi:hypothetical protein
MTSLTWGECQLIRESLKCIFPFFHPFLIFSATTDFSKLVNEQEKLGYVKNAQLIRDRLSTIFPARHHVITILKNLVNSSESCESKMAVLTLLANEYSILSGTGLFKNFNFLLF